MRANNMHPRFRGFFDAWGPHHHFRPNNGVCQTCLMGIRDGVEILVAECGHDHHIDCVRRFIYRGGHACAYCKTPIRQR